MSVSYLSAIPENNKASYGEYDTVDFVMTFENQNLVMGSVRLEADVAVRHNALPLYDVANYEKEIMYDRQVGGHSFIESISTEIRGEILENIVEYPRMVKQYAVARNNQGDMFNSSRVCELRCPTDTMTIATLHGEQPRVQIPSGVHQDPDMSIKLDCLLNSNEGLLPYAKSGAIRLSIQLARTVSVLYGNDFDANTNYQLHNLRLVYKTTSDPASDAPLVVRTRQCIKSTISTPLSNVQAKVPSANVEAFTASFQIQANENTLKPNNLTLEKIPQLNELQFLFNDSTNEAITYQIRSDSVVLNHFLDAMGFTGRNQVNRDNMNNNEGYGIGYRFDKPISLMNQKLSIQINSAISNSQPLVMYMYFHSVMEL